MPINSTKDYCTKEAHYCKAAKLGPEPPKESKEHPTLLILNGESRFGAFRKVAEFAMLWR